MKIAIVLKIMVAPSHLSSVFQIILYHSQRFRIINLNLIYLNTQIARKRLPQMAGTKSGDQPFFVFALMSARPFSRAANTFGDAILTRIPREVQEAYKLGGKDFPQIGPSHVYKW